MSGAAQQTLELGEIPPPGADLPGSPPRRHAAALAASTAGLALQALAYLLARAGAAQLATPLFLVGILVIFLPCAHVLIAPHVDRHRRFGFAIWLGLLLFVSQWLSGPLLLAHYDELLHETTLWQLVDSRSLFTSNTVLPISPYYPGLELFTGGLHWTLGTPALPSELLAVAAARAGLVAAIFLIAERLAVSPRAAGLAVLLYATSTQFYQFDALYAYETLALALAAASVHFVLRAIDLPRERRGALLAALASLAALAVTHHLTSGIVLALYLVATGWFLVAGKRSAALVTGAVALADALFVGAWLSVVGPRLSDYLSSSFRIASDQLVGIFTGNSTARAVFAQPSGDHVPRWEQVIILASVAAWCLLLLIVIHAAFLRRPLLRGGPMVWMVLAAASLYPLLIVMHVSAASLLIADRASSFVMMAMVCLVAAWWVGSNWLEGGRRTASLAALCLLILGGVLFGAGPDSQRLPGPYLVEADQRSVDHYIVDAAVWARAHVPEGTSIAADRDSAAVMAAVGHLAPVTQISGSINVGPLYLAHSLGKPQIAYLRDGHVRLLLVDRRLSTARPYFGIYFEPGESYDATTGTERNDRLTRADLQKFAHWKLARRIYANGPITIYDVSAAQGLPSVPVRTAPAPVDELQQTRWPVLAAWLAVMMLAAATRRHGRHVHENVPETTLNLVMVAVLAGMGIGLSVVLLRAPPVLVAALALIVTVAVLLNGPRALRWSRGLRFGIRERWPLAASAALFTASVVVSVFSAR